MAVADLAQPSQITLGRHEHAGRSGDRLDEAGGDGVPAVEVAEALQIFGELGSVLRLAADEAAGRLQRVPHVHDVRQEGGERLAVAHDAAQRGPADVDAVVGPLARDEADPVSLAVGAVIRHDDLQRGIDRLRAGIAEEEVIETVGGDAGQPRRQLERRGMAELEMRRVVHLAQLAGDGIGDLVATMSRRAAEQAGGAVEHPLPRRRPVVHASARTSRRGSA